MFFLIYFLFTALKAGRNCCQRQWLMEYCGLLKGACHEMKSMLLLRIKVIEGSSPFPMCYNLEWTKLRANPRQKVHRAFWQKLLTKLFTF
jgi:hypothetical protein